MAMNDNYMVVKISEYTIHGFNQKFALAGGARGPCLSIAVGWRVSRELSPHLLW